MVQIYHENLVDSLKVLDYPGETPSLRDFHIEMLRCATGVPYILTILPIVLADKNDNAVMDFLVDDTTEAIEFRMKIHSNPRYISQMEILLPFLDSRGFLDI